MSRVFEQPLFHGTIASIERIGVSRGNARKDFGRGFYMAMSPQQAIGMMHKKYREAVRRSRDAARSEFVERLYRIQLKPASESGLNVKVFKDDYLRAACGAELDRGVDAMYDFIKPDD